MSQQGQKSLFLQVLFRLSSFLKTCCWLMMGTHQTLHKSLPSWAVHRNIHFKLCIQNQATFTLDSHVYVHTFIFMCIA